MRRAVGNYSAMGLRVVVVLAAVSLAAALPAGAGTLPAPQTLASCQLSDGSTVSGAMGCEVAGAESVALGLSPRVTLSAHIDAKPGFDTIGSVEYAFMVVGGSAGDAVPVQVDTELASSAAGSSFASAGILLSFGSSFAIPRSAARRASPGRSRSRSLRAKWGTIHLTVQAASGFPVAGAASASADPFIHIDPAFANAGLYGIVVSDGVANVPVPEPSPTLLLGLGGVALTMRRAGRGAAARG